jgi:hypothetical protein
VFLEAAAHFQSWILVRRTNRSSLRFVGQGGYTPKRIDCKAKTADVDLPPYQLAGLVVDPRVHPTAFKPGKQAKAAAAWQSTEPLIGRGIYTVDTDSNSRHYGCLRESGKYIHGDYDLYDVIDLKAPSRNLALVDTLHGTPHMRGPRLGEIQKFVNDGIGSPMVQHGGEAQYTDHSEQAIDAFGPNGEDVTILNEFSVRAWYDEHFGGRRTLGKAG